MSILHREMLIDHASFAFIIAHRIYQVDEDDLCYGLRTSSRQSFTYISLERNSIY